MSQNPKKSYKYFGQQRFIVNSHITNLSLNVYEKRNPYKLGTHFRYLTTLREKFSFNFKINSNSISSNEHKILFFNSSASFQNASV